VDGVDYEQLVKDTQGFQAYLWIAKLRSIQKTFRLRSAVDTVFMGSVELSSTDDWEPTQKAWQSLFPGVTWVLCFLHTVLAIVQHCRRQPRVWRTVCDQLWYLYRAASKSQFAQHLRRSLRGNGNIVELSSVWTENSSHASSFSVSL
jgi:hypothetical protein